MPEEFPVADKDSNNEVRTETGGDDARGIADSASMNSDLDRSWRQSPKERLGLGGLIRHDRAGVPWPLGLEEELEHIAGAGAGSGCPVEDGKRRSWWKRSVSVE